MVTRQPWFTSPSVFSTGTCTSSKKISANPVSPSSCAIGRTVTPGESSGTRMNVSPRWRSDSGSVRKIPKHQSAHTARDAQIFWPLSTHSVPSHR